MRNWLLIAMAANLAACTMPAEDDGERVRDAPTTIVDGSFSGPEHDATVLVIYDLDPIEFPTAFQACTGVMVAPNVLATAKHCVGETSNERYQCGRDGEPLDNGLTGGRLIRPSVAENVRIYTGNVNHNPVLAEPVARGIAMFDDESDTLCSHDVAFVVLDREVDVPPMAMRLQTPPVLSEPMTIVGWGFEELDFDEQGFDRHFVRNRPVLEVGPEVAAPDAEGVGIGPRVFSTGPAICVGDSGAPAIAASGGLVGVGFGLRGVVANGSANACAVAENESLFIQLWLYRDLIEQAFALAGQSIWHEGRPAPGSLEAGQECAATSECAEGVCGIDAGSDVGFCADGCAQDRECDAGLVCADAGYCTTETDASGGCAVSSRSNGDGWWLVALALVGVRRYGFFFDRLWARGRGMS